MIGKFLSAVLAAILLAFVLINSPTPAVPLADTTPPAATPAMELGTTAS